ncbi:hypothetical protein HDU83_008570 [Entophlyctis luteolus]|nr:hypothetical protein HDU83_008570 [Entophlyctis luteolus]
MINEHSFSRYIGSNELDDRTAFAFIEGITSTFRGGAALHAWLRGRRRRSNALYLDGSSGQVRPLEPENERDDRTQTGTGTGTGAAQSESAVEMLAPLLRRRCPRAVAAASAVSSAAAVQRRASATVSPPSPAVSCAAVHLHSLPPPPSTFYRRSLPEILTSFNSREGKRLFKESLARGTAESFLHLCGNLAHQSEPAFCGLGSLAIVLNALEVDPNRPWKGAWRWYDETLLDCCSPLETIKSKGITFDEFASLAACNGLTVEAKRFTNEAAGENVSKQEFINDLKRVCSNSEGSLQMVVSFSRKVLSQTGDGHFSPVGCFHEESGMVLVLDVARFKYPSYFVHVDTLYDAMAPIDKVTGKGRGYFVLSKRRDTRDYQETITQRNKNSKSIISSKLKEIERNSCTSCTHDLNPSGESLSLVKITPISLSQPDYLHAKLIGSLSSIQAQNSDDAKKAAISEIFSFVLGNSKTKVSPSDGLLSLSFGDPAVDLTSDSSTIVEIRKTHDEYVAQIITQIESLPIYQIALKSFNECFGPLEIPVSQENRVRAALGAVLVVALPSSIYLSLSNPELRSFFMEAKYLLSEGPKSLLKKEVERLEQQLTRLI